MPQMFGFVAPIASVTMHLRDLVSVKASEALQKDTSGMLLSDFFRTAGI